MRLRAFLILLMLGLFATCAEAATRYVATNGSDSNSCSASTSTSTPKRNIMGASGGLACMSAGDTLYLRGGTYAERINVNAQTIPTGTSWTNAITIASYPNETATLAPSGGAAINFFAYNTNYHIQYIIFDRIVVDARNITNDQGITLSGQGSFETRFIRFQDGEVKDSAQALSGGCAPLGQNFNNVQGDGHSIEFLRSRLHHSKCGYGFYITGHDWLVDGNDIHDNGGFGIQISGGSGLNNHRIINNKIHGNGFTREFGSITINQGTNSQIYNNIIYNNNNGLQAGTAGAVTNLIFYNNTVYGNNNNAAWIATGSTGALVRNNIFYNNGPIENHSSSTFSNNLCGSSGTGCAVVGNPGFVSAAGGDFHIAASGSPAVNAGGTLGAPYNVDIEGVTRPSGQYTIGAYQFTTGAPPPNPFGNVARWSFDEGSGTNALDTEVGTGTGGHTCVLTSAGWATGIIGSFAFNLDGTRYCAATLTTDLKPPTVFGFSAWLSTTTTGVQQAIISLGDSAGLYVRDDGNLSCYWYDGSTWAQASTSGVNVANGTNRHVACTKDSTGLRIWVDGAQSTFLATTGTISYSLFTRLIIGADGDGASRLFTGKIDQVYVYDTAFDQTSVDNLFNELVPVAGMSVTHMAWYAVGAQGVQIGSTDADLSSIISTPLGIRWAIHRADTGSLTEYFRPFCIVDTGAGFPAWTSAVEVTNSFGSLGIRYYADAVITQGEATSALLPLDGFNAVAGKMLENPIDTTSPYDASQRITIAQGQHAEQEIRVEFGSPLVAGNAVQCRPYRENGTEFGAASYAHTKTLTLQAVAPPSSVRVGVRLQGGTSQ